MKKLPMEKILALRGNPWVKAVLCLVFVLSLTLSSVAANRVIWLMRQGAYESDGRSRMVEQMEDNLLSDRMAVLPDYYHQYANVEGVDWSSLDSSLNDPNFFFTIRSTDGTMLAQGGERGESRAQSTMTTDRWESAVTNVSNIYTTRRAAEGAQQAMERDHSDVSTTIEEVYGSNGQLTGYRLQGEYTDEGGGEQIIVTGYIREDLQPSGSIYYALHQADHLYSARNGYVAGAVIGGLLGLASLALLCWSVGYPAREEGIRLRWVDRKIPMELLVILGFFGLGVWGNLTLEGVQSISPSEGGALVLALVLVLAVLVLLIRRIKAHAVRETFLVHRIPALSHALGRAWRAVSWRLGRVFGKLPLIWGAVLGFVILTLLELFCVIQIYNGAWSVFLWVIVKVLEGVFVVYLVLSMRTLQEGARELADGNLDYQLPLGALRWSFREHGENLNHIRQAIQTAVEEQTKSDRMKTELITNVSHDIKTPLTSIISYVDLLKKQEMPTEEAREYLQVLDRQSARLKKLTEDLVEASKASTGNIPVNCQPTDLNVFLGQSVGEYEERLAGKDLTLLVTRAPEGTCILADGRLLWRVFDNLFGNIEKYALPGTRVYLDCQAARGKVTITFRNISANPLNISAEELMERFVRGDASRNTEGSGLGLAIAQDLVRLQGGTLTLAIDGDLFKAQVAFPQLRELPEI